jgi:hypothetical protein
MTTSDTTARTWRFFRAGGFDQVRLDTGAELLAIDQLNQKLWVALACPTTGLHFDAKTLALIDTDKDGRVRAPELISAVKWAGALLKNPDDFCKASDALPLAAINDATPEGKVILASARQILATLKKSAAAVSLEDTTAVAGKFVETVFNGDGIIVEDSASDDGTKAVIRDIIGCVGSELDRSGKPGLSQAKLDQFFAEATAYADWWKKAESDPAVLPLGEATAAAVAAVKIVKAKVDDYFTRCRLAAFDPRALLALNREEKEYLNLAAKDLTITSAEIAGFPLAQVAAQQPLPLRTGINPAWQDALARLDSAALKPLLGAKAALTEAEWAVLLGKLGPFDCWAAGKTGALVEKLGLTRLREILAGKARETLAALVAQDKELESQFAAIASVEKLVRFHRDLHLLAINFVNFKDFYDRGAPAIFQAGTLYLDQRSCELCLTVEDGARHATMAGLSGAYLAYCDCARKGSGQKLQIVAAFTDGDSDNLMVGRNGIFYDRKGQDWDATITKIVDNPISIRQAFWSPYKKVARFIAEQLNKRAAAADTAASDRLTQAVQRVEKAAETGKAEAPPPKPKLDTGLIAALSVGAAGIGGMIGGIVSSFLGLKAWMPVGVVGLLLLISGPSMFLAWLKLRRRNLGPLLDANGWAVNAKARINVPFGASLTGVAQLPPGAQRDLTDPYAEKKSPWPKVIGCAVGLVLTYLLLNEMGFIFDWTNGRLGTQKAAPAAAAAAPAAPVAPAPTPEKK